MIITDITINNYKSIGNSENRIYFNSGPTAIIGKNESGKSNVLEAIGNIPYRRSNPQYFGNKNRSKYSDNASVKVRTQFEENEIMKYEITNPTTEFTFTDHINFIFDGGLSEVISKDENLMINIENITKTKNDRNIWNINHNESDKKQRHSTIMNVLNDSTNSMLYNLETEINALKQWANKKHEKHQEIMKSLEYIKTTLTKYSSYFPRLFYRKKDQELKHSYSFEEIKEIFKSKNDIFYRLMEAAHVSELEMITAFTEKNLGAKENLREEIEEKIKSAISGKFNDFYTQEKVEFKPRFKDKEILFKVNTDKGKSMLVTERSNGLRWYLSLFIDILAKDILNSNVIFLFDEPGVHLHVNAQKELLKLFADLSSKGNNVIYTTHSPSMIDIDNLLNIRVVDKNNDGNTEIINKYYHSSLSSNSKMETLSPLIQAIGSDMRYNIGPQFNKINLITEGITDYIYVKAMLPHLNISEDIINIIPSAGAENINRIVSILIGWGCDFKVLLDYDKAGRKEYNVLVEKLDSALKKNIIFVNGEDTPSLEKIKSDPLAIEDVIAEVKRDKLQNTLDKDKGNKLLVAKEFHDKFVDGGEAPEKETIEAFSNIFKKLDLIH